MLLGPFLMGIGAAGEISLETLLFFLVTLLFFGARYPLTLLFRSYLGGPVRGLGRFEIWRWLVGYSGLGLLFTVPLLYPYGNWWLILLGALWLLLVVFQFLLERLRWHRTVVGELLVVAGLALAGPSAYYISGGPWGNNIFVLWILALLYWGSSVFYVKMRVSQRSQHRRKLGLEDRWAMGKYMALFLFILLLMVASLTILGLAPWLVPLAFAPLVYKVFTGILTAPPERSIRRLGFKELAHSVAFVVIVILAYRI
ncbi:MAG: YwiC-like family protein, partial [Chloroflexi bacterium]|nr:YwiC-like family protein [Chloroflexota bacterium]